MARFKFIASLIMTAGLMSLATSCGSDARFIGSWKAASPSVMTGEIPAATMAESQLSITFAYGQTKDRGPVTLTSDFDITETMLSDSIPSSAHYTATATIEGEWTYDVDDSDDLLLSFTPASLKVDMRPDAPTDPALGQARSRRIEQALRSQMSRFTVIDDVEVSKDGHTMTFEIQDPEMKLHFIRNN